MRLRAFLILFFLQMAHRASVLLMEHAFPVLVMSARLRFARQIASLLIVTSLQTAVGLTCDYQIAVATPCSQKCGTGFQVRLFWLGETFY
jgi:hypothetical protein